VPWLLEVIDKKLVDVFLGLIFALKCDFSGQKSGLRQR
jgi:hypothetical protein